MNGPAYATLIQHSSGRKVLFDLGVRKEWDSLAPVIVGLIKKSGIQIIVEHNVADIIEEHGVKPAEIEAVIWSHYHFDQYASAETFPLYTPKLGTASADTSKTVPETLQRSPLAPPSSSVPVSKKK